MLERQSHRKNIFLLILMAYFFLLFGNNVVSLTHPDEVFYVQTAKEMLARHNWLTPFIFDQPQFEKPVFTYWLLMIAIKFFGLTAFAARLWPAVFGIIGIIVTYWMAFMLFDNKKTAFLSAFVLTTSLIYITLARAVLTDMIFSIWIVLALAIFYYGMINQKKRDISIILYFSVVGLAVLTKGLLGFVLPLGVILSYLLYKKDFSYFKRKSVFFGLLLFSLIALPWHVLMIKWYGQDFVREYFYNVHVRRIIEAEHPKSDTWYFYLFTMCMGVFPWNLFLIPVGYFYYRLFKHTNPERGKIIFLWLWIFMIYFVVQSAKSKLASYIFAVFPAIAILIGYSFHALLGKKESAAQEKLFRVCAYILSFLFLLSSVGIIIFARRYVELVVDLRPVYVFSALSLGCALAIFLFTRQKKYFGMIGATSSIMVAVLVFLFLGHSDAEPWVSCKAICDVFKKADHSDSVILCSKFYVRGVRFYTDRKTAVIDINGSGFFSPHPIPYLNNDTKVRDFLNAQPVTYCIVKKSNIKDLKRITEGRFNITTLDTIGDKYLIKLEKT